MRIVGGKLRHRQIRMTNLESTRETQDKVREAIFNMIGPYFDGGVCLDLFAGSGAMALEAYSRGMSEIVLNDINDAALRICKENCKSLGINEASFYCFDYKAFLKECNQKFDLIILDPPYKLNSISEILSEIQSILNPEGIIVFEMGIDSIYPEEMKGLSLIKNKTYGIKRVVIYKGDDENGC